MAVLIRRFVRNWSSTIILNADKSLKEVDKAREIVRSKAMREAGIVYLDHEYTEITTSKGVKWKIYGTPVRVVSSIWMNVFA